MSLYSGGPLIASSPDYCVAIELSDGTANNRLQIVAGGSTTSSYASTVVNGSGASASISGNFFDGEWHKFTCAYKAGQQTFYRIDSEAITANHGVTLPTLTAGTLGRQYGGYYYLNGNIRNVKIYEGYLPNI